MNTKKAIKLALIASALLLIPRRSSRKADKHSDEKNSHAESSHTNSNEQSKNP